MGKTRLEAFNDGVIAILITIMVLEFRTPAGDDWTALHGLAAKFYAYVLSFVLLGIYWNNHHHMFHVTKHVTGGILWANLHLLFWLSLVPFGTAWMGEHVAPVPTAVYGGILFMAGAAYFILKTAIVRSQGPHSALKAAVGSDTKGKLSPVLYAVAIAMAFVDPRISDAIYVAVALMWLVPDPRIEKHLRESSSHHAP